MSSNARIFLAGVLTTFVILAVGFGGGLMLAKSALKEPSGYQSRASSEQATPVRVILPASAAPAQPPQTSTVAVPVPQPQAPPVKEVQAPVENQVENVDTRRAVVAEERRDRRKRSAERKSKRMAVRAKQQMEQMRHRPEPGILAFGGDEPRTGGFSGN
jgi:type IV secretory pathway VirB10-like protein